MNAKEIREKSSKLNGTPGNDVYILQQLFEEVAKIREELNCVPVLSNKELFEKVTKIREELDKKPKTLGELIEDKLPEKREELDNE